MTPPLRTLRSAPSVAPETDTSGALFSPEVFPRQGLDSFSFDPVVQTERSGEMPGPIANFEGISNLCGCYPPDTNGDIGPAQYMEWVNQHYAIYSRTGAVLVPPTTGNTLFTGHDICGNPQYNDGDPIVLYDQYSGRFFASQFAVFGGPYYQCIAVSQTPDPTGTWCTYQFAVHPTKFNDYPKFGVWPAQNAYFLTAPQFNPNFAGIGIWAFERDRMLACDPNARMVYQDLANALTRMLPADADGPTPPPNGAPNPIATMKDGAVYGGVDEIEIWNATVDWAAPSLSVVQESDLPAAAFDSILNCFPTARGCVPQPGTSQRIDTLSNRIMHRLQYRNFGTHQSMVVTQTVDADGAGRAGIRWYEFRKTTGSWAIHDQGTYAPDDGVYRFMGSAAMDANGNIAAGYSVSNGVDVYPGIRYAGRPGRRPPGPVRPG